jgi:hypothetical protein
MIGPDETYPPRPPGAFVPADHDELSQLTAHLSHLVPMAVSVRLSKHSEIG